MDKELEKAAEEYGKSNPIIHFTADGTEKDVATPMFDFMTGANWKEEHLWKDAQGDDLPEIDRDVIVLLTSGKVIFAHRPDPKGFDGTNIITGDREHYTPMIYDKAGWNWPNVKYWLDVELPKGIE